ncbi:dermonecrotic toxin domain-containing protein [Pseudomonas neuropathica]|uniref:dermonecrotic toxin domain-containing protein n=1 Tax=Pseudomonas neuropathica TaxID=2730425 RepID=UPI003EBD3FDC
MSDLIESAALRPVWLSRVSEQDLKQHDDLMQQLVELERQRDGLLGKTASLRTFAAASAKDWVNSALGVSIDPEQIKVTCRYKIKVGQRSLVQEDKRTFVELALFGLHDRNYRFDMAFEGPVPSGLTSAKVENWLSNIDIRSDFREARRKALNEYDLQIILIEALGARIAYSVFAATLQGHLKRQNMDMVDRFMRGDQSISASAVVVNNYRFSFRDLMVFREKARPFGNCVLFAPGSPDGRDWYEFPNSDGIVTTVLDWVRTDRGMAYLSSQADPDQKGVLAKYATTLRQLPSAWKGLTFKEWSAGPEGILAEPMFHQLEWDRKQQEQAYPAVYRESSGETRQLFARLHTELKALYTVGTREAGVLTYERFCYNLIKQRIEDLLKNVGENVEVNPDDIYIELNEREKVSLSDLIIKETPFYAHEGGGELVGVYPRLRLGAKHPLLRNLDIRQVASWSRTLRPGEQYIAMLRADYLNRLHPDYEFKREAHFRTKYAEMTRAVLSSYFAGELSSQVADQIGVLIDKFDTGTSSSFPPYGEVPSTVQSSAVFKFHVKRCLVEGVYVFRLVQNGKINEVLYTPNAPDGVNFRPLSQLFESIRERGLGQYLYKRVKYVDQPIMGTFINNVEFTNISEKPPVLELNSRVLSLRSSYNERIERIISDVDAQTTSLSEVIGKLAYEAAVLAASAVSLVIPPVGVALTVVQITRNVLDGAEAYRYGDRAAAFDNFKDALLDLYSLVPGGKEATKAQKTLIQLMGDSKTIVGLVASATGQKLGYERFLELLEEILAEEPASDSKTVLL